MTGRTTPHLTTLRGLPRALEDDGLLVRLAGRLPAVFLDDDGVLTPIVDHPADARISDDMRDTVRALALRYPVCVVSGRDRHVVQELMGIDDLVVAGSHGFDVKQGPGARLINGRPSAGRGRRAHPGQGGGDDQERAPVIGVDR